MFFEPLKGYRHVEVTNQRTAVDFAQQMKWLVDEAYPDATVVRVVLDNLNTHTIGSLYETFPPDKARELAERVRVFQRERETKGYSKALREAEI